MISRRHSAGLNALIIAVGILLLFTCPLPAQEVTDGAAEATRPAHYFIAYYFHTTYRCTSCINIEQWSEEAVLTGYDEKLRSGELQWYSINVDEPAHKHFADDYQLYTKSVILAEFKDGAQVRWKNMDKVWHLLRNKKKFIEYIRTEIDAWMKR